MLTQTIKLHTLLEGSWLITSGMMWSDIDPYDWLNNSYSCYMAIVVAVIDGRGLGIDARYSH